MGREVYPELSGREARRRLASEQADAEAVAAAMTRAEEAALVRAFSPAFAPGALAAAAKAEQRRVADLIRRDRELRIADALREAATHEVAEGVMVNLVDTVLPPTKEWLSKGEVETYTPRQPDGTVRTVTTVRRMRTPVVVRMARKGQISDDAAKACQRYAATHEAAGLDGNIPSVNLSREVFSAPATRLMFTDAQGEAQSELRAMRTAIPPRLLRFFEAVVLNDVPVHRASKFARIRRAAAVQTFRDLAEAIADLVDDF